MQLCSKLAVNTTTAAAAGGFDMIRTGAFNKCVFQYISTRGKSDASVSHLGFRGRNVDWKLSTSKAAYGNSFVSHALLNRRLAIWKSCRHSIISKYAPCWKRFHEEWHSLPYKHHCRLHKPTRWMMSFFTPSPSWSSSQRLQRLPGLFCLNIATRAWPHCCVARSDAHSMRAICQNFCPRT